MEYQKFKCEHPNITVVQPDAFTKDYLAGKIKPSDAIVSFSSLEHSGLGRYGDDLNPFGDIITMARNWCLVKPGGYGVFGMPGGPDRIEYNAHRVYGQVQLPHFFANWEQVYSDVDVPKNFRDDCRYCYQPIFVVRRPE